MPRTYEYAEHGGGYYTEYRVEHYTHRLAIGDRVILADPKCGLWNVNGAATKERPSDWNEATAERLAKPIARYVSKADRKDGR